jgi:glycosyltransferase involved in cell wall biosynthesis
LSAARLVLSVVAPALNEAEVIERFYRELERVLQSLPDLEHELILVDDGSSDTTLSILNRLARADPRLVPLSLSRNFGQGAALSAGLDAAQGDAVVLMDSDLQHPPALIPELVARWREGFDVVSTVRRSTRGGSLLKRWSSAGYYWALGRLSSTPMESGAADFCLLSRRVRDTLVALPERHRYLRGLIAWVGFRRTFVAFDAPERPAGQTKYDLRRMLRLALDGMFSFTDAPIHLAVRSGLIVLAVGLAHLLSLAVRRVVWGSELSGWEVLLGAAIVLGGLQIVFTGIVGEYLARVFEQVKGRPVYVLKQGRGEVPPEPPGPTAAARTQRDAVETRP